MPSSTPLRYPDFICIGAQKAGTTWLHKMLRQHPAIWLPPIKEIHFFNRVHIRKSRHARSALNKVRADRIERVIRRIQKSGRQTEDTVGKISRLAHIGAAELTDDWYGTIFQAAPAASRCGEMTPEYALLPDAGMEHMLRLKPGVKLMFIMRDPIERSWSALRMKEKRGRTDGLSYVQQVSEKSFIAYSDYLATIQRVLKHVREENFLMLFFDDIVARPHEVIGAACEFIGLDHRVADFRGVNEPAHVGRSATMEQELYEAMRSALAPVYERLLLLDHAAVKRWHHRHYGIVPSGTARRAADPPV